MNNKITRNELYLKLEKYVNNIKNLSFENKDTILEDLFKKKIKEEHFEMLDKYLDFFEEMGKSKGYNNKTHSYNTIFDVLSDISNNLVHNEPIKNANELLKKLHEMNKTDFSIEKNDDGHILYSQIDINDIKLPYGFLVKDDVITSNFFSISLHVKPLVKKKKKEKTIEEIIKELIESNPNAKLELKNKGVRDILYSLVEANKLTLPKGCRILSNDSIEIRSANDNTVIKFVIKEDKKEKTINEVFQDLKALNPNADLELKKESLGYVLYSKQSIESLKLNNKVFMSYHDNNLLNIQCDLGIVIVKYVVKEEIKENEKKEEPKKEEPKKEEEPEIPKVVRSNGELFRALKILNKGLILEQKDNYRTFYSSIETSKLKLPDDWNYNEKGEIVSNFQTSTGSYLIIPVLPIEKYLTPEIDKKEKKETNKTSRDIFKEIEKLNPNAEFEFTYEKGFGVIYSTIDANKLKLPDGFVYDEENGINNKATSTDEKFIHISVRKLIIEEEEIDTNLNEFENMLIKDAEAEGLELYDQEFEQMMNGRTGINKTRVIKYLVDKRKKELRSNLDEFELKFVDDAQAKGLMPGDPEFEQMYNERVSLDRDKVVNYCNDRIFTVVIPKQEKKKVEPKIEEPELEDEEDLENDDEPTIIRHNTNRLSLKEARKEKLKQLRKEKGLLAMFKYMQAEKKREKIIAAHDYNNFQRDIVKERKLMGEDFKNYTRRGFTDIFILSIVTIIIGILLVLIIKLI